MARAAIPTRIGPISGLSQATVLTGAILAAWVLWLAVNNKLIVYWQILMGQGGAMTGTGSTASSSPPSAVGATTTTGTTSVQPSSSGSLNLNDPIFGGTAGTGVSDPLASFGL